VAEEPIAINIALVPDAPLRERARALNARLRGDYPAGFPLDESHVPHLTLCQAFVRRAALGEIWLAVEAIPVESSLRITGLDYFPKARLGTAGYEVARPGWLDEAHQAATGAVRPFALADGEDRAFVTTAEEPQISESTLNYVRSFFDQHAGEHFNPHITLGSAHAEFLDALCGEDFSPFDFGLEAIAVFQLGDHGTCRRLLFERRLRM